MEKSILQLQIMEFLSWFRISYVLLAAVVCLLGKWYLTWRNSRSRLYELAAKIPGPPYCLPILGHAWILFGKPIDFLSRTMKILKMYPEFRPMKCWVLHRLIFVIRKPENYEICQNTHSAFEKSGMSMVTLAVGKYGLVNSTYPIWKKHRRMILPTLNSNNLNSFQVTFAENSQNFVGTLEKLNKDIINCETAIHAAEYFTIATIFGTIMGLNSETYDMVEISKTYMSVCSLAMLRVSSFLLNFDFIYNLTSDKKKYTQCKNYIDNLADKLIRDKREEYHKRIQFEKDNPNAEIFLDKQKNKVFLDHLVELSEEGEYLSDEEIKSHIHTFIIAGFDTSFSAIIFTFELLGIHKDVEKRIYDEIMEHIGPDRAVEAHDLSKLEYTERAIKEALRLFPPGALILRKCDEDIQLESCTIPAGSEILLMIVETNRDEHYWHDALKFDPDRFLPENIAKVHPYAFNTFLNGPKNCIGQKFAMMEMKTFLATVMRRYECFSEYKSVEEIELTVETFVLSFKKGHKFTLKQRL